jgi:hypothetical protein
MSDIAPNPSRIQVEATSQRAPVSESLAQSIGGSINHLLGLVLPVGSVVGSMLTEGVFQTETSVAWILADGRNVSGSAYSTKSGFSNVPDLRGVVPRGKNNGRSAASGNADGDLALGTYQGDQLGSHTHGHDQNFTGTNFTQDVDNGSNKSNTDYGLAYLNIHAAGGNESRGRNVTVNYMIRIN